MKRFSFVLLVGVLGLSAVTALALRQGSGRQGTALPELKPESQLASGPASQVASRQIQVPAAASCDPAAMLPIVQQIAPEIIVGVNIKECQKGYARVLATPQDVKRFESEQVFLKDVGGTWDLLTWGTGIACSDPDRSFELDEACDGLGLS